MIGSPGNARREARDDQLGRAAIRDRDRLVAGLHLDAERAAAHAHDLGAGVARELERGASSAELGHA